MYVSVFVVYAVGVDVCSWFFNSMTFPLSVCEDVLYMYICVYMFIHTYVIMCTYVSSSALHNLDVFMCLL